MSIIEAKCPNCGAPMKIDNTKDACYCEYCKTPFVTEKVIKVDNGDYVKGNKTIINKPKEDNDWKLLLVFVIMMIAMMLYFHFN